MCICITHDTNSVVGLGGKEGVGEGKKGSKEGKRGHM